MSALPDPRQQRSTQDEAESRRTGRGSHAHVRVLSPLPASGDAGQRPTDIEPGNRIAGRYRVDGVIGRGGMATVYRGFDERLLRDVAIKVRHALPGQPAPPLREEQVSSRLLHANIVSVFDAGQIPDDEPCGGCSFIVMEYVRGTTAHEAAPVHWSQAVEIVRQVATGLSAAHEQGVVHCDVTPGNVLIDRHGRVLLADFGVAVEAHSDPDDYVHGSPSYIAPERVQGAKADPRVDVYGLGGVFAYLLTGKHPPVDGPLDLPENVPGAVREIIDRARSHDSAMRYADGRAFADALAAAPSLIAAGDGALNGLSSDAVTRHLLVERAQLREAATVPADAAVGEAPVVEGQRRGVVFRARALVALALGLALALLVADAVFNDSAPATFEPAGVTAALEMPDVNGMSFADAIERLSEQGIVVTRVDVVYEPGPQNQVVAQQPAPGQEVGDGDPVTLVVRTGR